MGILDDVFSNGIEDFDFDKLEEKRFEKSLENEIMAKDINEDLHNEWVNYFEGVITPEGSWLDLNGSHTSILENMAARKMKFSLKDFRDQVPDSIKFNYEEYLLDLTAAIAVRFDFSSYTKTTPEALNTLDKLLSWGKIRSI